MVWSAFEARQYYLHLYIFTCSSNLESFVTSSDNNFSWFLDLDTCSSDELKTSQNKHIPYYLILPFPTHLQIVITTLAQTRPAVAYYYTLVYCTNERKGLNIANNYKFLPTIKCHNALLIKRRSQKKCSFNLDFVHKGGGGGRVQRQTKRFWTLFVKQIFWNFW